MQASDFQHLTDDSVIKIPAGVHRFAEPVRISGRKNVRVVGEDGAVLTGTGRRASR